MADRFYQTAEDLIVVDVENASPQPGDSVIWLTETDGLASGGVYINPYGQTWDKTQAASIDIFFNIANAGDFELFVRIHTDDRNGAFWIDVDNDAFRFSSDGYLTYREPGWVWRKHPSALPVSLSIGDHVLKLTTIHSHVNFDKIALVPVGSVTLADGETGFGPAESSTVEVGADPIAIPDLNFLGWLENRANDSNRILLVELDHADGTVYLASSPWLSPENIAYDDWLVSSPVIDQSLGELFTLGDIEAVNPVLSENWLDYDFHGYQTRLFYGDLSWDRRQFRTISTGTIDDCLLLGGRKYRFNVSSSIARYSRQFHVGADVVYSYTVQQFIEQVISGYALSGSYSFINFTAEDLSTPLTLTVTDSLKMDDVLRSVARSVGGDLRITQRGQLEFIKPDYSVYTTITNDNIVKDSVQKIDAIHVANAVKVIYNDGNDKYTVPTNANAGGLARTVEIESLCSLVADAQKLGDKIASEYSNQRRIYSAKLVGMTNLLGPGDLVNIVSDELIGVGVVSRIKRKPLYLNSDIEVVI